MTFRDKLDMNLLRNKKRKSNQRRGTATVELAVCLPVIVLVAMGAIEGASMAFLRQTMVQSAYEGVKVSVRRGSNAADGLSAANAVVDGRGLQGVNVSFNPSNPDNASPGDPVTITVTAPGDANSILPFGPFQGRQITVTATMAKE